MIKSKEIIYIGAIISLLITVVFLVFNQMSIGIKEENIQDIVKPNGQVICDKSKYDDCDNFEKFIKNLESNRKSYSNDLKKVSDYCKKMYTIPNKTIGLRYEISYSDTDPVIKCIAKQLR